MSTALARDDGLRTHHIATVGTVDAAPIVQMNVGTAAVVGREQTANDQKEIEQPSRRECLADG